MSTLAQRSFAGGEIAPSLYARVDTVKYQTGLRTMRNNILMRHGGAANRPGTEFIGETKDSTKATRLIPFVFNSDQTYCLEFGDLYMRVIRAGAYVVDSTKTITGITKANPCVVTAVAHGFSTGDEVTISGVSGMTQVNGRNFKIIVLSANTFSLTYMDGTAVNSTAFTTYVSGGSAQRIYTLTSPYAVADLPELQFVQSADVITFAHPSYAPRELARSGHASWTFSTIDFVPSVTRPTNCAGTRGAAGGNTYKYKVSTIKQETYEESLTGFEATKAITGATQANPCVITSVAHGYSNGDEVYITGVLGMTQINNLSFTVANVAANTFELSGINSTSYTAYSSGGTAARTNVVITAAATPTSAAPNVITWTAVTGAQEYNVYKESNGIYGFIGIAGSNTFSDTNIPADTTTTPPIARNPFSGTGNYPSAVTYIQQRRFFANTDNEPETAYGSKISQFTNFTTSTPIQDDDSITFAMVGRQVNEIRHILELGKSVVLTAGGEWAVLGNGDGVITPTSINLKQYSYNGSSTLPPIVVGGNALYVQARGSIVRDLSFDYQVDGYRGNDLTIFSAHLFDGYTLSDWTYQQIPHSIVWVVRSDGTLLGLTYVREHEVFGWHHHDFGTDIVENVCAIPEGNEDVLYLVIKRTINGSTKRYVERMAQRRVDLIEDSIFTDCTLSYDGTNVTATTMTLSGSGWTYEDTLTLTASTAFFTSADVGNEIHIYDTDGSVIRCSITAYTSTTVVSVLPNRTVPVTLRSVATTDWTKAVDEVTGLWHLEGKTVSVFADGFVVASPYNDSYETVTVSNGTATLERCYGIIHVGLPYISDLETLDIDTAQGESIADKKKMVQRVTLFVEESRGAFVGAENPGDDTLTGLRECKIRESESYDSPIDLQTGTIDVNIQPQWNSNGRVFIRNVDPIPLSVLAIVPSGKYPFGGGN